MSIPDYQTLMLPVLRRAAEGETRVADVAERIADDLGMTQAERDELLPSGRQRVLHNRIHWAKFYMSKAGLIASPARGRFVATGKGKALLATAPKRIDVTLLMQEPEFREFYKNEGAAADEDGVPAKALDTAAPSTTTPEEQIDAAHAALKAAPARRPASTHPRQQSGLFRATDRRSAGRHGLWRQPQGRRRPARSLR